MTRPIRRLLHIEASPRASRSRSAAVARRFLAGMEGGEIERLALFETELPHFDGSLAEGRYALIEGGEVDSALQTDWAAIRALVDHFLSFDAWLFSTPMWNFGIPYRLKHYIDLLTQPGMTFSVVDGQGKGSASGRMAILVGSGALDVRGGGSLGGLDFQIAYLEAWLRFIGVSDIRVIHVRPTYGAPDAVEAVMDAAYAEADALASSLCLPDRV